jgi:hypothetical protein
VTIHLSSKDSPDPRGYDIRAIASPWLWRIRSHSPRHWRARSFADICLPQPDARIATVFECRVRGQRIYSDQRCGPEADERPIQAPNRMDSQDTSILSSPDVVLERSRSERGSTEEPVVNSARSECDRIEQEKNSINARMREGYGSPEGERLRDRLRLLGDRYYDLHCRHFHWPCIDPSRFCIPSALDGRRSGPSDQPRPIAVNQGYATKWRSRPTPAGGERQLSGVLMSCVVRAPREACSTCDSRYKTNAD